MPKFGENAVIQRASPFDKAFIDVLKIEGGYNDTEHDRGGKTNYGISQKAYPDEDIKNITEKRAKELYKKDYWDRLGVDSLPDAMKKVAFDAAINHGVGWTKDALKKANGDVQKFIKEREKRYAALIAADPTQEKFRKGWEKRLDRFRPSKEAAPTFSLGAIIQRAGKPAPQGVPVFASGTKVIKKVQGANGGR